MALKRILSSEVGEMPPGLWSNAMRAGDLLFISGQVARAGNAKGPGEPMVGDNEFDQSKQIFTRIRHLVEAAGGSMADIVKLTIYVVDISKNKEVWRARQEFFTGDFPTSTLVEVSSLAKPEVLVEIEAVAYLGDK